MSEEKKIEPTKDVQPKVDNSKLIPDPPAPVEEITEVSKDKSGFQGAKKDEEKGTETVLQKSYNELEKKLGTQGKELGDFKNFFQEISPLLDKLDAQPELVQAIIDGKIDGSLAKAAIEGKISISEAEAVTKANEEVKKEIGKEEYSKLKPEEIEKKITEKVSNDVKKLGEEITKNVTKNVKKTSDEAEEMRDYKESIDKFIKDTKDFPEYAEEINKWIDEHPEQDDIKIAYDVVKGRALQKKLEENSEVAKGEAAKAIAANAAGGGSQGATVVNDKSIVDQLIGNTSNPNTL